MQHGNAQAFNGRSQGCDRELPLPAEGIKGGSEAGVSPKTVSGMDGQVCEKHEGVRE
jgi:hypothetical protein